MVAFVLEGRLLRSVILGEIQHLRHHGDLAGVHSSRRKMRLLLKTLISYLHSRRRLIRIVGLNTVLGGTEAFCRMHDVEQNLWYNLTPRGFQHLRDYRPFELK